MKIFFDGSTFDQMQTGSFNFSLNLLKGLLRGAYGGSDIRVYTTRRGKSALSAKLSESESGSITIRRTFSLKRALTVLHSSLMNHLGYSTFLIICVLLLLHGVFRHSPVIGAIFEVITGLYLLLLLDEVVSSIISRLVKKNKKTGFSRLVDLFVNIWKKPKASKKREQVCEIMIWRGKFRRKNSFRVGCILDMTPVILPSTHATITIEEFSNRITYYENFGNAVLTISESSRIDIVNYTKFKIKDIYVLPLDIDDVFKRSHYNFNIVKKLSIPDNYILCVSTIEPRKNLRRLIKAFELLKQDLKYSEYKLVLVGPKGWDYNFDQFLLTTDVYNEIICTGHVSTEDLPALYHFASIFVFPSIYEGFGLPVLEAMSSEAFVVSSRSSSMPEILGDQGLYFNPFNTLDILNSLKYALSLSEKEKKTYRIYSSKRAKQLLTNDYIENLRNWIGMHMESDKNPG